MSGEWRVCLKMLAEEQKIRKTKSAPKILVYFTPTLVNFQQINPKEGEIDVIFEFLLVTNIHLFCNRITKKGACIKCFFFLFCYLKQNNVLRRTGLMMTVVERG